MPQITDVRTKRFRISPISPDKVSDAWIRWTSDPVLMAQMNARVIKVTRADLQRYVAAAWKTKRMILGIYTLTDGDHIGLYEAAIDPRNANVTFDTLVDQQKFILPNVLSETDPALLEFLGKQLRLEKAVAQIVETNAPLIRHYEGTGWVKEGVLRQEVEAVAGGRRLDMVQFGRLLDSNPAASAA